MTTPAADPASTVRTRASVATDRAARYGKQLASHLGRKVEAEWDAEAGTGHVRFPEGQATAALQATDSSLDFELQAHPDFLDRYERVLGDHLVRFGARDGLVCAWTRELPEGSTAPGTSYGPVTE